MKRPRKRLKIENVPTVVPLLFFSSHAYGNFKEGWLLEHREMASIRTPMVARHGNNILVVTDLEKVPYDDAVDRAASHSQAGVSTSGNNRLFCRS